jgi:hypothetical protein
MIMYIPYLRSIEALRKELLPVNFVELSNDSLILGSSGGCVTLTCREIAVLVTHLVTIHQELHERQMP